MKLRLTIILILILLTACATVNYDYNLPPQALDHPTEIGKTRVIFYNDTNPILFGDGSWRIGIKIDGLGVQNLHLARYVQVDLELGLHKLELSHIDVFTFRDSYDLEVSENTMYIRVFNGITSTKYEIMNSVPDEFSSKFKPAG